MKAEKPKKGDTVAWVELAKPGGKAGWQKVGVVKNILVGKTALVSVDNEELFTVDLKELTIMKPKAVVTYDVGDNGVCPLASAYPEHHAQRAVELMNLYGYREEFQTDDINHLRVFIDELRGVQKRMGAELAEANQELAEANQGLDDLHKVIAKVVWESARAVDAIPGRLGAAIRELVEVHDRVLGRMQCECGNELDEDGICSQCGMGFSDGD